MEAEKFFSQALASFEEKDYAKAVELFTKAAELGLAKAMCNLGNCYYHGIGVANDDIKALECFGRASEQGDAFAIYNIGNMYLHGRTVEQDTAEAVKWFLKSAEKGNPEALKTMDQLNGGAGYVPREPLIYTEPHFDILENESGALLFCISVRDGEPRLGELYYSGGTSGLLRRRLDQYILLEKIHEGAREKLTEIGGSEANELLFAEFIPSEEKTKKDKNKEIIREYTVPVRRLHDAISLESIEEIRKNSYVQFASLAALAREQTKEGKSIAEIIPKDQLPILAAVLAIEDDYQLLDKYIAEKLPLNKKCPSSFKDWRPTPLFYITTKNAWPRLKDPEKMLRYLVQHGADINLTSEEGDTPLGNQCCADGNAKILKALLEAGADPNTETVSGGVKVKPLTQVLVPSSDNYDEETHTYKPHAESVVERAKLLVEFGADVNGAGELPVTPLALALAYSAGVLRKELVTLLCGKGARIDAALECMETQAETYPEFYFALYEFYAGFPDLLESDSIPEIKNHENPETALRYLELAAHNGYKPAEDLIEDGKEPGDCWV